MNNIAAPANAQPSLFNAAPMSAPIPQAPMAQASMAQASVPQAPMPQAPVPQALVPQASVAPMPTSAPTVQMANTPVNQNVSGQAQKQVQGLLSSPNLQNIPEAAKTRIASAVSSPRSYNDVINTGSVNKVDVSALSPEIQRAYDIYQQSMILGASGSTAKAVYAKAGVDRNSPDAFFEKLGLVTGTPTKEALAKYAPVALEKFGNTGSGALTFTVDPKTVPADYQKPNIPMTKFNMGAYTSTIMNNPSYSQAKKQSLITNMAQKYGFNPADFI
jgi:hypothetical protein